jgi:hypothetical protein
VAASVPVQLFDMGFAADAVAALQVPADVLNRVCEAMALVADAVGIVTGAQLLRIVIDEGVAATTAVALRRGLNIAAAVPPRTPAPIPMSVRGRRGVVCSMWW